MAACCEEIGSLSEVFHGLLFALQLTALSSMLYLPSRCLFISSSISYLRSFAGHYRQWRGFELLARDVILLPVFYDIPQKMRFQHSSIVN